MKGAARLQQAKFSLELIEEAVHLLRTAPAGPLACYYVGALPFVLGALYFWADMSRSAQAYQHLETGSLSMALLFVWMKFWQALFGQSLRALMTTHAPAPWSWRRSWRLFLTQTALQPTGLLLLPPAFLLLAPFGLLLLPLALLLLVPFGWVYAFYQNLTVLADDETPELRAAVKAAARQAALWPRQNHLLLAILFGFGMLVFVNWSTLCYLLPNLAKTLLGLDSTFSRSGLSLLNSTFFAAMFGLTYLCVDPILKTTYALRCFYGQSLQSGEDLKADLRPFSTAQKVAAGLVLAFFVAAIGLQAGEIRNPKSEIRKNSEAPKSEDLTPSRTKPKPTEFGHFAPHFVPHFVSKPRGDNVFALPGVSQCLLLQCSLATPVPEAPLKIAQCFNIGFHVPKESFRSEGTAEPPAPHSTRPFGNSGFGLLSDFGLRTSDFPRAFPIDAQPLINTVASARCQDARQSPKLFQQFIIPREKPLKRLRGCRAPPHRAKATVALSPQAADPKSTSVATHLSSSQLDRTIQDVLQQRKYTWRMPREKQVEPAQAEKGPIGRFLEKVANLMRKWLKAFGNWLEEWLRKLFQRRQTQAQPASSGYGWILSQELLLCLLVAAVVVGLGLLIYRIWRVRQRQAAPLAAEAIRPAPDLTDESVGADQLPEDGWMKLARELLDQGELRLALRAFYLASLAHLAERNLIRLAKFKSNRDYELELRRRAHSFPELLALFAENVSVFDRIWYGLHNLSPEIVARFAANVERLKAGGGMPRP